MKRAFLGLAIVACAAASVSPASATPRPLPFTYTTETLGQNELEVEQYVDLTPVKIEGPDGNPATYIDSQFQTEFEYGITDRLELGLYVVYVPTPDRTLQNIPAMTEVTGAKERLRYVFADPGEWPIDVGVYGELVEGDTELEFEGKVLLQRRLGHLRLDVNLWAEYEDEFVLHSKDVVLNPTAGATYEITPVFHLGVEGWMRVELPNPAPNPRPAYGLGPTGYVGPAVLFNFGKLWWSTGIYARVNDVNYAMQPGDPYGPVWARMVLGFEL